MITQPHPQAPRALESVARKQALRSVFFVITLVAFWVPLGLFALIALSPTSSEETRRAMEYFGYALAGICAFLTVLHALFAFLGKPWQIPGRGASGFIFNTVALGIVTIWTIFSLLPL
jgi:hypothetical protein